MNKKEHDDEFEVTGRDSSYKKAIKDITDSAEMGALKRHFGDQWPHAEYAEVKILIKIKSHMIDFTAYHHEPRQEPYHEVVAVVQSTIVTYD